MTTRGTRLVPLLIIAASLSAGCSARAAAGPPDPVTVDVRMRYSRFEPAQIAVPAGTPVTFVLRNDDFIDHEFIVGDDDVQARHEAGTEPAHGARPEEVDVPAGATVRTTVTFARSGKLVYACHVPGHFAYGMTADLTVR